MCRLAFSVAVLALVTSFNSIGRRPGFSFQLVVAWAPHIRGSGLPASSLVPRICARGSVRVRRFLVVAILLLSKYGPSLSLPRQANVWDVTQLCLRFFQGLWFCSGVNLRRKWFLSFASAVSAEQCEAAGGILEKV